jgi:hypothetical protein
LATRERQLRGKIEDLNEHAEFQARRSDANVGR